MVKGKNTKVAEEDAFPLQNSSYQKMSEQLIDAQVVASNPLYSLPQTFDTLQKEIEKSNTSLPKDEVGQLLEPIEENYAFTQDEEAQGDSETLSFLAEKGKSLKDYDSCKVEEPMEVTRASAVTSEFWQTTTTTSSNTSFAPRDINIQLESPQGFSSQNPKRPPIWNIPADNADYFVGREAQLEGLRQCLTGKKDSKCLIALSGLGGVGKTQLAIHYLHHSKQAYALRLWFHAEKESRLLSEYQAFARQFQLIPLEANTPEQDIIYAVKCYLEKTSDWLAVYDNAGRYAVLDPYLPKQGGHLLLTTRLQEWSEVGQNIDVPVFSPDEALSYLKRMPGHEGPEEEQAMGELAKELGYLPLALAQARAYIKKTEITGVKYLKRYRQQSSRLLADKTLPVYSQGVLPVAITGNVSLKAIEAEETKEKEPHVSVPLLRVMAYVHAEAIPRALLAQWLQQSQLVLSLDEAEWVLDKAIAHLRDYSMIQAQTEQEPLNVHRLVQEVIRTTSWTAAVQNNESTIPKEELLLFLKSLAYSLSTEFNRETKVLADEAWQKALVPHLHTVVGHYDKALKNPPRMGPIELGGLLDGLGYVFFNQGAALQAKEYWARALTIQEAHYGNDHWQVAKALNNLALAYGALGDAATQKTLLLRALPILEANYGQDHWQVAITLGNLAIAHRALGDTATAKTLLQRALALQEAHYGNDHWQVAKTLGNLATAHGALGDAATQKTLLQRALAIQEAHYGQNHWQVAKTLGNLATAHGALGDAATAKTLLQRALTIQEAHYGQDHYMVPITLTHLAAAHGALGDAATQKTLLQRALTIQEAHYGQNHCMLLITLTHLATVHGTLGNAATQKTLLQRALIIQEAYYGQDHWQVASTLVNLATAYGALGDATTQKTLLLRALPILEANYGQDHLEVVCTLHHLGTACLEEKNFELSRDYFQRAGELFKRHGHPHKEQTELVLKLTYIREGNAALLHNKENLNQARLCYEKGFPGLDPKHLKTHQVLLDFFYNLKQLAACIEHCTLILQLVPYHAHTLLRLACFMHVKAQYEQIKGNEPQYKDYLQQAERYFKQSIVLGPNISVYTQYAQFMLRHPSHYSLQQILGSLCQARQSTQQDDYLSYGVLERVTVDVYLQKLIDAYGSIELPASILAHYLLIQAYRFNRQPEEAHKAWNGLRKKAEEFFKFFEHQEEQSLLAIQTIPKKQAEGTLSQLKTIKKNQSVLKALVQLAPKVFGLPLSLWFNEEYGIDNKVTTKKISRLGEQHQAASSSSNNPNSWFCLSAQVKENDEEQLKQKNKKAKRT